MSTTLTHNGLPGSMNKARLLSAIDAAGPRVLNLTGTAFRLLKHAVLKCRESDFLKGRICGIWDRPSTVAADLGIDRRVLDDAERLLEQRGLIARTWTLHAARGGERRDGRIQYLAGINLAPMIDGFDTKVAGPLADASLQRQAVQALQFEISDLWREIRSRADDTTLAMAEAILPGGRKSRIVDVARLEVLKSDLEALLTAISEPAGARKSSDRSEDSCAPNILPRDSSTFCSGRGAAAMPTSITPRRALRLASEEYRTAVTMRGGPSWPNLVEAAAAAITSLGIPQRQWGEACQLLGRERAALCVLVIDRTHRLPSDHPYQKDNPGGCLGGMLRKHRQSGFDPARLLRAIQGFPDHTAGLPIRAAGSCDIQALPGVQDLGGIARALVRTVGKRVSGELS